MRKRNWIRPKKRVRKVSWRSGKIREDAAGMAKMRWAVFTRSEGQCENKLESGARCRARIGWAWFELHHVVSRARGGSDTEENCMALCAGCHFDTHNGVWKAEHWPERAA